MELSTEEINELMARVKKLELNAKKLVQETFAGDYHSSFKGRGLDFDDFREYHAGDEIRFIDWNATARTGSPQLRTFKEERELNVYLVIDVSGSTLYGSGEKSKRLLATEIAATLIFAAINNNDEVGLILFADTPIKYIPPGKGRTHALRMIREVLAAKAPLAPANLSEACHMLNRVSPKKALVFLISDFQDMSLERSLATTAYRHDLIALRTEDPAEARLPKAGKVALNDPETGHQIIIDTANTNIRMTYRKMRERFREGVTRFFKKHSIDYTSFSTDQDFFTPLHKLLKARALKRRS